MLRQWAEGLITWGGRVVGKTAAQKLAERRASRDRLVRTITMTACANYGIKGHDVDRVLSEVYFDIDQAKHAIETGPTDNEVIMIHIIKRVISAYRKPWLECPNPYCERRRACENSSDCSSIRKVQLS